MTKISIWSLLLDVVAVNPAILLRTILSFKEDVVVVFTRDDFHASRHVLWRSTWLLGVREKCLNHLTRDWFHFDIFVQLGNCLHCARFEKLGPKFDEQAARRVNIRAVHVTVNREDITNHVGLALHDS